jgi:hypothetical protein
MAIGTENFGNGSAKTDGRFPGQPGNYRSAARRDSSAVLPIDAMPEHTLGPRNGSRPRLEQRAEPRLDRVSTPLDTPPPIASSLAEPKPVDAPLVGLGPLGESVFSTDSWLDSPSGSLADHPLLRGLLQELPPKGLMPPQDWLDRWFEAARSILELLYSQDLNNR